MVEVRKRYEFDSFGLATYEWPPVAPVRDDFSQYEIISTTNIIGFGGPNATGPETYTSTADENCVGVEALAFTGATFNTGNNWPTANLAMYFPVYVVRTIVCKRMWWIPSVTPSGNVDIGIYDTSGNRLVHAGSTSTGVQDVIQVVDVTDTTLPRAVYYLGFACDNNTSFFASTASAVSSVQSQRSLGMYEQTAAMPLPATATFAQPTTGRIIPLIGFVTRSAGP